MIPAKKVLPRLLRFDLFGGSGGLNLQIIIDDDKNLMKQLNHTLSIHYKVFCNEEYLRIIIRYRHTHPPHPWPGTRRPNLPI